MAAAELQLGGRGSSEPPPRIPTPELLESEDVDMPDIDMDFSRHEEPEEEPVSPAEHVRRSVDRFNAFDRHISVLRSSSPPVIPLPTSLSSRQASLSPPTLPPLPLVDLGLDPEDDEDGDEPENIPSSVPTNASTPPRLDLNLPPTTSLSPGPSSPHVTTDETSTQFRERLDSAIDGLGGGDLHFEAPISPPTVADGPSFDRYFEPVREALTSASDATPLHLHRPTAHGRLSRARYSIGRPRHLTGIRRSQPDRRAARGRQRSLCGPRRSPPGDRPSGPPIIIPLRRPTRRPPIFGG
ncbi:hypothetical protein B0H13DRAFT_909254 [Mycena leptocephala]|nr:hypothetical protein B0H13DRAFT_909254 [Mycena leptocephala]